MPFRGPIARPISAWLIQRRLTALTQGRFGEWVFWLRFPSPELVQAMRSIEPAHLVYEPVDHYAAEPEFTNGDRRRLQAAECELAARATVVTSSAGLQTAFQQGNKGRSHWLPIGTDEELVAVQPEGLSNVTRPRLVVTGSFDWLADSALLERIATERPGWQLLLAGPRDRGWGRNLDRLSNVHWLGVISPEEARGLIAASDVALNPCVLNEWTRAAVPVKIFDYLAEGKFVVSTPMAELAMFGNLVTQVPAAGFVEAIEAALTEDDEETRRRRRRRAQQFTAQQRARRAFDLIMAATTKDPAMKEGVVTRCS